MKNENFCKVLIISFINLISFLLSAIFLVSINNAKEQSYYLSLYQICDYHKINEKNIYSNYYKGIATLFSFSFLGFFIFVIALSCLIYKEKIMNPNNEMNDTIQSEKNNELKLDHNNELTESRVISFKSGSKLKKSEHKDMNDELDNNKKVHKCILSCFGICQIMYFIEVMLLTALFPKSKKISKMIKKNCNNIKDFNALTRICIDLFIVGYIFLFIFIILFIYLLILYGIFGEKAKNIMQKITNYRCYTFFDEYLGKICFKCNDIFKPKNEEEKKVENKQISDGLRKIIEKKDNQIKELEEYKKNLEEDNKKYLNGTLNDQELSKLNLYKIIQ